MRDMRERDMERIQAEGCQKCRAVTHGNEKEEVRGEGVREQLRTDKEPNHEANTSGRDDQEQDECTQEEQGERLDDQKGRKRLY